MLRNLYFILLVILLSACPRKGCKDINACNFDPEAKRDDGSCNYGCKSATTPECSAGEKKFFDVLASKNINCFYQGNVFSILTITQNRYQTCVSGNYTLNGYTENIITFKNVTKSTITFDYQITQNYNGNIKEYQGYISKLAPGATTEVNTGDNTFYNLNYSTIQMISNNIIFE